MLARRARRPRSSGAAGPEKPYSGNAAAVTGFLNCLQDAVCDRLAFYQLTAERQQHAGDAWEEP
jgi:hypothetical protein